VRYLLLGGVTRTPAHTTAGPLLVVPRAPVRGVRTLRGDPVQRGMPRQRPRSTGHDKSGDSSMNGTFRSTRYSPRAVLDAHELLLDRRAAKLANGLARLGDPWRTASPKLSGDVAELSITLATLIAAPSV
jgi:hypothetical protein